jgi:hypothetical protein
MLSRIEAAPMRGDDQVVVVDDQVAYRTGGHVEAQRLPVLAIVETDVGFAQCRRKSRLGLGSSTSTTSLPARHRESVDDFSPRLAAIVGAEDVGAHVVVRSVLTAA